VALCEPDTQLRALLGEWLHRADLEPVTGATDGASTRVALVVADVPAPRQDGALCVALMRRRFPNARVLAISGKFLPGMCGATAAALALGADAVLAKPFAAEAFIDAVRALIA
jgi:DNA-binding NarL/FixJ family response regulator